MDISTSETYKLKPLFYLNHFFRYQFSNYELICKKKNYFFSGSLKSWEGTVSKCVCVQTKILKMDRKITYTADTRRMQTEWRGKIQGQCCINAIEPNFNVIVRPIPRYNGWNKILPMLYTERFN